MIERLFSPEFVGLLVVPLANLESTWVKFLRAQLRHVPVYRTWEAFKIAPAPKLLLQHYEALTEKRLIEKLRKVKYTFIGYDESQRLKNRSSLTSRIASKLRNSAEYKLILSGTPIEENPSDLWAQFRFLNPQVFGERWKDFDEEFLEPIDADLQQRFEETKPGSFKWKLIMRQMRIANNKRDFDFDQLDEFLSRIDPYSMRVTNAVLNLPPCHVHEVRVRLRGEQRRIYRDVARDMVASVGSGTITAPLRVTQLGRLHQISGGHVVDDDGNTHEVGRSKLRALKRLVLTSRKPLVVFCRYLEEIWAIRDALAGLVGRIETLTGKTKKKDRGQLIADFQAGLIQVLVCQIKTGGVGIDLYRASIGIFYSSTYSYIDFEQARARLHRRGQESEVHLFLIIAVDTVDEDIYSAILSKRRTTSKVLIQLERRRSNGQERQDDQSGPRSRNQRRIQVRRCRHREGTGHRSRERSHSSA